MKHFKLLSIGVGMLVLFALASCEPERELVSPGGEGNGPAGYEGHYVGYSWGGEAGGTSFEDASTWIQTILRLDEDGVIEDAQMWFWRYRDGYPITRQTGNALVAVDFDVDPTPAALSDYSAGTSMFDIYTEDMMSFYATAADSDGTVALAIVDPMTRFQFEMKLPADFDFGTPMSELTINSGMLVPTIRTSGGGFLQPDSWDEIGDDPLFDFHLYSHVLTARGPLQGLSEDSSVQDVLEALGVSFSGGEPQEHSPQYGYTGIGGWFGNYEAIADYLEGQDATELTSLVDWSVDRFSGGVNDDNVFGVDVASGATRTAQDSVDGISGATVRMSRESTSYQRALVDAGILSEEDVIIGRF